MTAYYNEIDPYAAQWLRNLAAEGLIASGDVDGRSIADVVPGDLRGYAQCHFFAGLGGWSRALRLAGWPDDRSVWTGSCPCQPFSAAGKRRGFADDRHLWPVWAGLIRQCAPAVVFGEQVARATDWLALVHGELEAMGYAVGCLPIEAASVGAPHLRDRIWFVADAASGRPRCDGLREARGGQLADSVAALANPSSGDDGFGTSEPDGRQEQQFGISRIPPDVADPIERGERSSPEIRWDRRAEFGCAGAARNPDRQSLAVGEGERSYTRAQQPAPERADWWAIEPDVGRVAHGVPARVAKLRALGNAIVPEAAAAFIGAFMGGRQ